MKRTVHAAKAKGRPISAPSSASPFSRTFRKCKSLVPVSLAVALSLFSGESQAQQWQILGTESAIGLAASNYTNITLVPDADTSIAYVAYTESNIAKVKKRNADGSWTQVGGNVSAGTASYTRIYTDKTNNLYVTYVDGANGSRLAVKKYNAETGAWEALLGDNANLYVSAGSVNGMSGVTQYGGTPRSSLAFDSDNNPYIAFAEGATLVPYVKKFDGATWVAVGGGAVVSGIRTVALSLVLDESDQPWLAFCNVGTTSTGSTGSLGLYNFNGTAWTAIANTIGGIRHTYLAINSAGNPAIAYFNTGSSNRATVAVYNKAAATWSSTVLGTRDSPNISLLRDASGNLYCSFLDFYASTSRNVARVFKQYTGTTAWKELKDPLVSAGVDEPIGNPGIAVGSDTAAPYIVYTKTNTAGYSAPVVRKFIPPAAPVTIATSALGAFGTTTAVIGGDITADGGSPVTERGVVYSLTSNPTISNNKVVAATTGSGAYTVNLSGLSPATLYYIRAYAINAGGVSYGGNVRLATLATPDAQVSSPKQVEFLTRALVAVRRNTSTVFVSWRLLATDPSAIGFNLYRDGVKVNQTLITGSTNFLDTVATNGTYTVRPVLNGVEGAPSASATAWANNQLTIPLQIPDGGTTPDGVAYTYTANDASVGDVDGDGAYEIFLKWDPTKLNHNSGGYSGDQIIDCYKLDGTRLWRINLGKNLNAGPHFTQFMVYDLDGDGKAEIAMKTADGTIDGTGTVIGDPLVDYRNSGGWVDKGPEYLTVFNGQTGAAMATVPFGIPRGQYSDWGDSYGNRAERYVSAVAYLDGARPSLVIGRGYYDKLVRAAYDWRNGQLTLRWKFDSKDASDPANNAYSSMGNHQMTIGDVDGDGKDEVINGSSAIDDDGTRLWTWGYGHGDALHMTDMDPDRPGQEIWQCLESPGQYDGKGIRLNDAKTGQTIFGVATTGDVGRALAADVDPTHRGFEMWSSSGTFYNVQEGEIGTNKPVGASTSVNHAVWWDGDLGRELFDGTILEKWNPTTKAVNRLVTVYQQAPISSNNDTKKNAALTADILGDWREEILLRKSDNSALILFTTNIPSDYRIPTLMQDPQYRTAIAWQNSGYNQPPHPGFYLGYETNTNALAPYHIAVKDIVAPEVSSITRQAPDTAASNATSATFRVIFSEEVSGVDGSGFTLATTGNLAGTIASVTALNGSVYEVTVDGLTGEGDLRLDAPATAAITDASGNALAGGFSTGETFTRVKAAQTISFGALQPQYVGDQVALSATASSGAAVTYSSSNPEVATINGSTVQVVGAGTTTITASQQGDNRYLAATPVAQTLTAEKKEQAITFASLSEKGYGDGDFDAGAAASSGLSVAYASSNPEVAEIVGGKVRIKGLGTTLIAAAQEGNYMYKAAATLTQSLTVKDKQAPLQPQALTTTKTADGRVGLMWQAPTDDIGVTGYYVFLNGKQLNEQPLTVTSFITDAPSGSLVYAYTVIAADAAGNLSPESATALFSNSSGNGGANASLEILKVFPNPNEGNFKVRLNSKETGTVNITICNAQGAVVQSTSEGKSGDVYQREFRMQGAQKGMYLVRVAVGTFVQTSIVMIQ
ncbi:T9SS type A sorting domain-containing protein [Paraflavisolibacter sp. H34]|uniref:rhamnogalacturonan lyase family protein n=1 Tax=Huijunlia imazamoxiresistens TaxID=3127457 RepID=UPI00301AD6A5